MRFQLFSTSFRKAGFGDQRLRQEQQSETMFVKPLGKARLRALYSRFDGRQPPKQQKGISNEEHDGRLAELICKQSRQPHLLLEALDRSTLLELMRTLYQSEVAYGASSKEPAGLAEDAFCLHMRCKVLLLWEKDAVRTVMLSQINFCACWWLTCGLLGMRKMQQTKCLKLLWHQQTATNVWCLLQADNRCSEDEAQEGIHGNDDGVVVNTSCAPSPCFLEHC